MLRTLARRRRVATAAGALLLVALAVAIVIATTAPGSSQGAGNPRAPAGSATVQRRDLVATDTESGTLSYANPQTVYNRMSGTITWLPSVGQTIKPGQTLYEVDNQPVVLFNGSTPAYRDLSAADTSGPDVLELNRDLHAMGFDASEPITLNDTWQAATSDAVERWQGSLGQSETGTITLGQVVFLPGTQRITAIEASLGSTGGNSSSATGASTPVVPRPEFASLTRTVGTTGPTGPRRARGPKTGSSSTSVAELKALTALLKAETQELRSERSASGSAGSSGRSAAGGSFSRASSGASSSRSGASGASGGSGGSAGASGGSAGAAGASAEPIMQTSSTQLVVTVDLDASKQSEAVVGGPVTVQMPNGNTVDGKITAVSPVAQTSSSSTSGAGAGGSSSSSSASSGASSSGNATVPVTVTLNAHLATAGLDQASVSVNFEQQVVNNVLSVPVTALLATQGGGYAVQEATPPHRLLAVTPGVFAAGYVQISGSDIYPGLVVTDSQG